ncbi:CocE/NonD family hydrolase [Phycisphaerales bacterium AB-hyl4]|uniref:CocE/NonD family hydrolase n=1 Tax=Natronomicrosphaera hydrolytica TaxID=3242702 RepID=A0ABV4U4U0_9BACT
MKTVERLPREIREMTYVQIPMPDGIRLAVRLWLPVDAEQHPVPAILEYIPYRQRDWTARRDSITHPYLAGHGYACARVDLRGSGDSEGVLQGEYLEQELIDGEHVIAWLADQPWCDGSVGMMGISWGGFNGLQIAARQPPALKAIITIASTDDRYADDVHYAGGCLLGENLSWASTMFAYNTGPPDPEHVGEGWRDMWLKRLADSGLWLEDWLTHQRRDDFWKHGSINEYFDAIQCPVMAVSGWADAYTNAVFRLLEYLNVPRCGLVGPWSHKYPHFGVPGPAIGFLQEAVRWWDQWLKHIDTGIMNEPMLRAYVQDSVPPATGYKRRPGWWVGEPTWPSPNIGTRRFHLSYRGLVPDTLHDALPVQHSMSVQSPLSLGLFAGKWCSEAAPPDLPDDQRHEDGGALTFDTAPLSNDLEVLGPPVIELELSVDRPVAMVAVRLSDILPDGRATRVSYALLNLTHRHSHEHPEPVVPHKRYRVQIQLNDIGQLFPAGHCVRVALSTSYWPLAWPPPEPVTLTVYPEASRLLLPQRLPHEADGPEVRFPEPEGAPGKPLVPLRPAEPSWRVIRDLPRDESCLEVVRDHGAWRVDDTGWTIESKAVEKYTVQHDDLKSLRGDTHWTRSYSRGDWSVKSISRTVLTSDETHFHLIADLDAYEGERRVFSRSWHRVIPRELL